MIDHQDFRTYKILEAFDKDHMLRQRDIANQLNISLGLVNSFVKRLSDNGYIATDHQNSQKFRYVLTGKGKREKERLQHQLFLYAFEHYKKLRERFNGVFTMLADKNIRQVIFFGACEIAEIAFISLQSFSIELVAIADIVQNGQKWLGRPIIGFNEIDKYFWDHIIITADEKHQEIYNSIVEQGIHKDKITNLKLSI